MAKKILVTGADGFVAKNLILKLQETGDHQVLSFRRGDPQEILEKHLIRSDLVIHLAGENRPKDPSLFVKVNVGLTKIIADFIRTRKLDLPIIFASSAQAREGNVYGESKKAAEKILSELEEDCGNPIKVYRWPGLFGKWCKPNYNSVVATFCKNVIENKRLEIFEPSKLLRLNYIDDVVDALLLDLKSGWSGFSYGVVKNVYEISLKDLASRIEAFKFTRSTLDIGAVGGGLERALYATFVSYLEPQQFAYPIPSHEDDRGVFVEMLKTSSSGQFSYFSAKPGVTRGGHYHHSKTEKFLVIKGKARFRFRDVISDEKHELYVDGTLPQVVDTATGWSHDITNVGDEDLLVMLWANEVFDENKPDTFFFET